MTSSPVARSPRETPSARCCSDPAEPLSRGFPAPPRVWAHAGLLRPGHRLRMVRSCALLDRCSWRPVGRAGWRLVGPNDGAKRPRHETRDDEEERDGESTLGHSICPARAQEGAGLYYHGDPHDRTRFGGQRRHHPAHDVAAVDVLAPLLRPEQPRDIPGPHLVNSVLLRPLPYEDSSELARVWGRFLPESGFDFKSLSRRRGLSPAAPQLFPARR